MFEENSIHPLFEVFIDSEVDRICQCLGGDLKSVEFLHTDTSGKQLVAGQFKIVLTYSDFLAIQGPVKFMGLLDQTNTEAYYQESSTISLHFVCVIIKPQTNTVHIFEKKSETDGVKLEATVDVDTVDYFMSFIQIEDDLIPEYEVYITETETQITFTTGKPRPVFDLVRTNFPDGIINSN